LVFRAGELPHEEQEPVFFLLIKLSKNPAAVMKTTPTAAYVCKFSFMMVNAA
jgi:hypothetical protein